MSKLSVTSGDTSSSTLIIDYSDSLRVRGRRQVTWSDDAQAANADSDDDPEQTSTCSLDDSDDGSNSFVIENLDTSPSSRRRRRKRNKPKQPRNKKIRSPQTALSEGDGENGDRTLTGLLSDESRDHITPVNGKQKKQRKPRHADDSNSSTSRNRSVEDAEVDAVTGATTYELDDGTCAETPATEQNHRKKGRRRRRRLEDISEVENPEEERRSSARDAVDRCISPASSSAQFTFSADTISSRSDSFVINRRTSGAVRNSRFYTEWLTPEAFNRSADDYDVNAWRPQSFRQPGRQVRPQPKKTSTGTILSCGYVTTSIWMVISLGLLALSNVVFMTAFVTQSWGEVQVISGRGGGVFGLGVAVDSTPLATSEKRWSFGLWRCCRDDGICLGAKWPAFYSATRTFAVLALFGHALSLALIFGHTVEKLLDYDPCTMLSLISGCFITAAFVTVSVAVYGSIWPTSFQYILASSGQGSSDLYYTTSLGYSFFLAVAAAPLTTASGILAFIDFRSSLKAYAVRQKFISFDENSDSSGDDDEDRRRSRFIVVENDADAADAGAFPAGTVFFGNVEPVGDPMFDDNDDEVDRDCLQYLDRSSLWQEESLV